MRPFVRASDVIGHVVLDLGSGEELGRVHDVVYQPRQGAVVGFTLDGGLGRSTGAYLPVERVAKVGEDAITVDAKAGGTEDAPPDAVADASDRDVLDGTVYTESGTRVGAVVDVVVGLGSGVDVVAYEFEDDDGRRFIVRREAQRSVSGDALLLNDGWADATVADLDELGSPGGGGSQKGDNDDTGHARDGRADDGDDSSLTKQELYERAQRLDVAGRSSMTKSQLAAAVAEASDRGSGR